MSWLEAFIVAVVEGLTEFLPVSSTGHMIITEALLGMQPNDFSKAFIINIQFGAILSVIVLYWRKFFKASLFTSNSWLPLFRQLFLVFWLAT